MNIRRVRLTPECLDRVDMVLASSRSPEGEPSAQDFLTFDVPAIIDVLAISYERFTVPAPDHPLIRTGTFRSTLVGLVTVHTVLTADDDVEIRWITFHEQPHYRDMGP